jgi:hypothetical protein
MAQVPYTSIGKQPKCPLCFKLLDKNDCFLRFCPQHDDVADPDIVCARFDFTEKDLQNHLHCAEHRPQLRIQSSVFLLHQGCKALNPFANPEWKDGADQLSVADDVFFRDSEGRDHKVTHWLIETLRKGARYYPEQHEMWFPQIMLSAMYERQNGKPAALFVKLCGSHGVGKTILATMAMYERNYTGAVDYLGYDYEEHFVYLPPASPTIPAEQFLRAVYPLAQLQNARIVPGGLVTPTRQTRLNLKVVFLSKAKVPPPAPKSGTTGNGGGGVVGAIRRGFRPPPIPSFIRRADEPLFTIVFYDTAGEEAERADGGRIKWLDQHADVVTALLDANDLVRFRKTSWTQPADYQNSVPIACNNLLHVINPEAKHCLVVTKIDTIPDGGVKEQIAKILDDPHAQPGAERALLRDILAVEPGANSADRMAERDLSSLVSDYNKLHRVFFLWTDNLGTNLLPETRGLLKFMKWCREDAPKEEPAAESAKQPPQARRR